MARLQTGGGAQAAWPFWHEVSHVGVPSSLHHPPKPVHLQIYNVNYNVISSSGLRTQRTWTYFQSLGRGRGKKN